MQRRELAVHGLAEHDVSDNFLFTDSQCQRLLRDLFVDQRSANETRTDDIGTHAVLGAFFGHDLGKPHESVFCGYVRRLQRRGFF